MTRAIQQLADQLEALGPTLAAEAFPARIEHLERRLAERGAECDALRAEIEKLVGAIVSLEADREARLEAIRRAEQVIVGIEADRAARLVEIHRLIGEVGLLRAEIETSPIRRLVRRYLGPMLPPGNAAQDAAQPSAESPETATFRAMSTDRALWRIARRETRVGTVIDVGASNGMWSAVCERHYPDASYLLVEAQDVHRAALEAYCGQRANASYVLAAAGPRKGEIWFDDSDPFGGLASERRTSSAKRRVPVTTLDDEVASRGLKGPFLVKLDVHGFEVPILEGATRTLAESALVVIECYTFRIAEGSLLFDEMVAWMRERGFGVLDASEPLWRARDACLWQMDLFFAPLTRQEFAANTWS